MRKTMPRPEGTCEDCPGECCPCNPHTQWMHSEDRARAKTRFPIIVRAVIRVPQVGEGETKIELRHVH